MSEFNILAERVVDTAFYPVEKANGTPMIGDGGRPCEIEYFGPATDEFAAMQQLQRKRAGDRFAAKGTTDVPIEQELADKAADLASITKSFRNFVYPGEFATPADMHAALYRDRKLGFIRDGGQRFVSDWGNFSPDAATQPSSTSGSEAGSTPALA